LLSHTMKLWERVIEKRLRKDILISENQFGFMPGRSTTEAIYLLIRLMELYKDRKVDLHMVFIYLKKAYDRVPREVLWGCLEKKECLLCMFDLLRIYTWEVGRMLGLQDELPTTSSLVWAHIRVPF